MSNYNDITSNKGGAKLIPPCINNKEFEFRFDKGMNFIPFINGPKNNNNQNVNNFINYQMNNSIKKMREKINETNKLIKTNNDNINNIKKKISNIEEESKQYDRWIQKEEEENERLIHFLNFLLENKI